MLQTSRTTRAALLGAGLILAGAWLAATAAGQTAPTTSGSGVAVAKATVAHGSVLDPEATAALEKMGACLRSLQAFQVQSTTTREDVLLDGQKVQRIVTADLIARRPDRPRVEFVVDGLSYYQCGSTWYQPQFVGTSTSYLVVGAPR